MHKFKYYLFLSISIIAFVITVVMIAMGNGAKAGIPFIGTLVAMAFYAKQTKVIKGNVFTFWVFAFLATAMYYPWIFTFWFGFNTKKLVVPLIQIIMFGMGTKLSIADFVKEFKKPKAIIMGTVLIYTIMPLLGVVIAKVFHFPPEIAAGVILIGSCPTGAASNVMNFLANNNLALSVSIATFSTLISPIMTPFLMKLFAGKLIEISFVAMVFSIMKMVIIPIIAGLIVNKLLRDHKKWLDKLLPRLSMTAVLLVVTVVVAHYRNELLLVGLALIGAAMIHNILGYTIGYWATKLIGVNERDCRTMAMEIGMKNGSMGMGLALDVLKSADASLAPIIFGKWMNISGSTLANYWRLRPVKDDDEEKTS